jgi:protein required for attachment to host cells
MLNGRKTWVLVMDAGRAQAFDLQAPPVRLQALPDAAFEGSRKLTQELTADRPGHGQESMGAMRHTLEPRTTAHEHAEEMFAAKLSKWLAEQDSHGAFEQLILVAPPRALSDLRDHLPSRLRSRRVLLEIASDWTKLPGAELDKHLQPHLVSAGLLLEPRG